MNFIRYVCNRSQELAMESTKAPLTGFQDAEFQALQFVFECYRFLAKVLFIPAVFANYCLVLFRIRAVPAPALELARAQAEAAKNAHLGKQARKVGFQTPQKASHGLN